MELLRELSRLQHEHGWLDDETLRRLSRQENVPLYRLEGLVSFYPHFRRTPPPRVRLDVCRDVCCRLRDPDAAERLRTEFADRGDVEIHEVSCLGRCDSAPAAMLNDVPLAPVTPTDTARVSAWVDDPAQFPPDEPTATPRRWKADPYPDLESRYGTVRSLVASGEDVRRVCVERLQAAGLRGMGGAGFPTARKWGLVADQPGDAGKYVICNADESEPGTFKDRVILEELPHLVLEGMLLAGLSVGAGRGIVYLRHEYTRERKALEGAINDAYARGILGNDAAGSGRAFDVESFLSPGGYILGEETALLEALEDRRGEPRNKPPYPGQKGLWGRPTLINNVETLALATAIVHHGPDWWAAQGHDGRPGLKFVSISGDVERPGVYEIPHGLPVSELIARAGGMKDGRNLKGFLPGGASSSFLRAEHVDLPLDFDALAEAGSLLGTGAVIVFAEGRDLYDAATNITRFFRNESCGKCVPCRIGTERAVAVLEGAGDPATLGTLDGLAETLEQTSICGLGQVALKPVLSMLKRFPEDIPG